MPRRGILNKVSRSADTKKSKISVAVTYRVGSKLLDEIEKGVRSLIGHFRCDVEAVTALRTVLKMLSRARRKKK